MTAPDNFKPEDKGCGNWKDVDNGPKTLATPAAEQPSVPQGCGTPVTVEKSINTAHDYVAGIFKKLAGYGEPVPGIEQTPDNLVFNAKKRNTTSVDQKNAFSSGPQEGTPAWNKLHPHGKYEDAGYHVPEKGSSNNSRGKNGNSLKSPCPKDGQAVLDNSFGVKDSKERVAVQDGKIVILKQTSNGLYHGYIVEKFHLIKNANVQKALVENGLVNNAKSGTVIK